jgi:hypothetical protein
MKKSISPGNIHRKMKKCKELCRLYEHLIQEVVAPAILAAFCEESAIKQQSAQTPDIVVLYQFPPTVRMYGSHLPLPRNSCDGDNALRVFTSDKKGRLQRA